LTVKICFLASKKMFVVSVLISYANNVLAVDHAIAAQTEDHADR
jgi:hypothetical protein